MCDLVFLVFFAGLVYSSYTNKSGFVRMRYSNENDS